MVLTLDESAHHIPLLLDPTVEQHEVLARHAGASRFAFNQCLRIVKTQLTQRKADPVVAVPWTGFDLINAFNAWKKTEDAGRVFTVDIECTDVAADWVGVAAPGVSAGVRGSRRRPGQRTGGVVGFALREAQR